jgi:putative alpha-1,2-mannosidase
MENGREVVIVAHALSPGNIYIQSARLNGRPLDRAWFRHAEIRDGATFEFEMGPRPSAWGTNPPPPSPAGAAGLGGG